MPTVPAKLQNRRRRERSLGIVAAVGDRKQGSLEKWRGEGVTTLDANTPGYRTRWREEHPHARLIMRLQQGDLIEADNGRGRKVYRVSSLWIEQGTIPLAEHNQTGDLSARHKDPDDPFQWWYSSYSGLKKAGARRVRVDPIGRVSPAVDK